MKKARRQELKAKLKQDWESLFNINLLNDKGKAELRQLICSDRYKELSLRDFGEVFNIHHSTISEYKKDTEKSVKETRGRPKKLKQEDEEFIMKEARAVREEYKPLTINYLTFKCNEYLAKTHRSISRYTISRLLRYKKWRKKHTVRKQVYCLSNVFDFLYDNWKKRMRRFFKKKRNSYRSYYG